MDRREFLMIGTAATAAGTLGCSRETVATPEGQAAIARADVAWSKAPCRFCGTGCGVEVGVADGKVVAVRGDELSPVNKGLLCVKGYHLPALLYGRDRLQQVLSDYRDSALTLATQAVLKSVRDFTQDAIQEDDLSLMLARFHPPSDAASSPPRKSDPNGTAG